MSLMKLSFAGQIKKIESKNIGGKPMCEISLCKKNRTKEGAEASFTWIRVQVWSPAAFHTEKLIQGAFISGVGDLSVRSFINKDGVKQQSIDVNCQSWDIEMPDDRPREAAPVVPAVAPASRRVAAPSRPDDSEPPF